MAYLTGAVCVLEGMNKDLPLRKYAEKMAGWINDEVVNALLFSGTFPADSDEVLDEWLDAMKGDDEAVFAIQTSLWEHRDDEKIFIGTCGLYQINGVHRTAELRIFIGNAGYWGQGIGTEATRLLVGWGFNKLNLNCIWLGVNEHHEAAISVYEKVGFAQDGILRQRFWRDGRYHSLIQMSLLAEEHYGV